MGVTLGHESKNWNINSLFQSALSLKIMILKHLHLCIRNRMYNIRLSDSGIRCVW